MLGTRPPTRNSSDGTEREETRGKGPTGWTNNRERVRGGQSAAGLLWREPQGRTYGKAGEAANLVVGSAARHKPASLRACSGPRGNYQFSIIRSSSSGLDGSRQNELHRSSLDMKGAGTSNDAKQPTGCTLVPAQNVAAVLYSQCRAST